jgi:hypothetical protein
LALAIQTANPNYLDKGVKFLKNGNAPTKKKSPNKRTTGKRKKSIVRKRAKNSKISHRK